MLASRSDERLDGPSLRERWRGGSVTLGGWCSIGNSFVTELMGHAGFDWLCIDLQHGLIGMERLVPMLQACDAAGIPALVRVPDIDGPWIAWALDRGASGVIVPMVETADDTRAIVAAARYAPMGRRSWGPTRAAVRTRYDPSMGDASLVVVMVETVAGVDNIDAIMATTGVDAVLVGPADMALSSGRSVPDAGAATTALIGRVIEAGRTNWFPTGVFCQDLDETQRYVAERVAMVVVMSDVRLLRSAAATAVASARAMAARG